MTDAKFKLFNFLMHKKLKLQLPWAISDSLSGINIESRAYI